MPTQALITIGNGNSRWTVVDAGPNLVQLKSVYDGR